MSKKSKTLTEEIRNLLLTEQEQPKNDSTSTEEIEIEIGDDSESVESDPYSDEMADADITEAKKCEEKEADAYGMTEAEDAYGMTEAEDAYGMTEVEDAYGQMEEADAYGQMEETDAYGQMEEADAYGQMEKADAYGQMEKADAYGMTEGDDPYAMKEADAYGMTEGDDPYAMKEADAYGVTEAEDPYAMAEEDDMELDVEKDVKEMVEKSKSAVKLEVFSEKLNALIAEDKSLSEEFKKNAATLFEAALSEKLANLSETFEAAITAQLKSHYDFVVEKVDGYLTYAVEAVIENNQDKVDSKLRNEIAESFIADLKEAFEKNYIEVPEGKVDVYAKVESENKKLSEKADRLVAANKELNEKLVKLSKEKIIREASEGLYVTQIDRLKKLTESVEFVDEKTFANKVKVIRETYFSKVNHGKSEKDSAPVQNTVVKTRVVEDTLIEESDSVMGKYVAAISKHMKR